MERLRSFVISRCPDCSASYSARSIQGRIEKKPLILPCSHCICESCLVKELKAPGDSFKCKDCSDEITAPPTYTSSKPEAEFPVNYYLLGLSILKSKACEDSGIGFSKARPFKSAQKIPKAVKSCNECIERSAEKQCLNCGAPYCSPCFTKVHGSARALRSHVAVDIETCSSSPVVRTMCMLHPASPQQAWCELCSVAVCTNCLISDHSGHKAKPLEEKNKELFDELVDSHIQVMNIATRLKATSKKASSVASRRSEEPLRAERQISDFFSRLHGALLLKQHHLLAELYAPSRGQANILRSLVCDMEATMEDLDKVVAATRLAIADQRLLAEANFSDLIEQLKNRLNEPCHLVMNEAEDSSEFHIEEDKILSALDSFCTLKAQSESESRYRLVTTENIPEGYVIDPIPEVTRENLFQLAPGTLYPGLEQPLAETSSPRSLSAKSPVPLMSSASSRTSVSSVDVDNQNQDSDISSQSNHFFHELVPGASFSAKVVHVISPNDFYVQKAQLSKKLLDMQLKINEINFGFKSIPTYIKMSGLYMVKYKDSQWYRGQVVGETDKGFRVFYIDYGNTEIVPKENIRKLPTSLYKPAGLALHCSLNGCVPAKGDTWIPEAVAKMLKIIDNCPVTLTIKKKSDTKLYVDMYKVDTQQGQVCIQDSLIFLGLAVYLSDVNVKPPAHIPTKSIPSPPRLSPGEVVDTFVCTIVSPHEFYIQNLIFAKALLGLQDALQEFYSKKNEKFSIYSPKKGSIVAAMQSSDNRWYRAKIIDIPGVKMVRVQYLDYGNIEEIAWQRIRVLAQKFYSHHEMCYKCSLVDIAPVGTEWEPSARYILTRAIKDPRTDIDLSVVIHSTEADKNWVVLYQRDGDLWLCLNTILVEEGAAVSTGRNSTIRQYSTPGSVKAITSETEPRTVLLSSSEKKQGNQISSKDPIKVPVKIIRIVSPGEFYFTLETLVDTLAQMQKNLNALYSKKSSELKLTEVETGGSCVARKPGSDSEWYRGYIVGVEDTSAQVNLVDTGEIITVPKDELCQLEKEFEEVHDGAKKCHLGGIVPPFEGENWPLTAISEFKHVIDKAKDNVFITGMGDNKDDSLPVNVLLKEDIMSGALEPSRTKWTSVNNLLRRHGLAKSDGTVDWETETSFETIAKSHNKIYDEIMNFPAKYHGLASNLEEAVDAIPELAERQPAPVDLVTGKVSSPSPISPGPDVVSGIPPPTMPVAWPKPLPFARLDFIANPTNVDNDCSIFIQDFQASITHLAKIGGVLENCCKFSLPMPYDFYWNVGETCICRYHDDRKWYRGVITEINEDKRMTVLMVDYGSIEDNVPVDDLRKMPLETEIPIQGQFCKVNKIKPAKGNKWGLTDLDTIHRLVVEKHCPVQVEKLPDGSYEIVKITLPNGADLFETLVAENIARFASDDLCGDNEEIVMDNQVEACREAVLNAAAPSAVVEEVVVVSRDSESMLGPLKYVSSALKGQEQESVLIKKGVARPKTSGFVKSPSVAESFKEMTISGSTLRGVNDDKVLAAPVDWVHDCEKAGLLSASDTPSEPAEVPIHVVSSEQSLIPNVTSLSNPMIQTDAEDDLLYSEESGYMYMSIPEDVDQFEVEVQLMNAPNRVVIQIRNADNICIDTANSQFADLMAVIQKEAEEQQILANAQKGSSCLAKFSADQTWYRGIIEEVLPNQMVRVKYVDYGNMEDHPVSEVRQLPFEWTNIEVQGIEAVLYNIKAPNVNESTKRKLEETLCGNIFMAKVKERSPELVIELYQQGTHELAYSSLIEEGVLCFIQND